MSVELKICVAVDSQGGFAKDNEIPWNIPEDFRHFMQTTKNSICLTGKNSYLEMVSMKKDKLGDTYDPLAPTLATRDMYVVSSTLNPADHQDCTIVNPVDLPSTLRSLCSEPSKTRDLFVLGGQQLFEQYLQHVEEVIITRIPDDFDCDRFFPMDRLIAEFDLVRMTPLRTHKYGDGVVIEHYMRMS